MRETHKRMLCLFICIVSLLCALMLISGLALSRLVTVRGTAEMLAGTNPARTAAALTGDPVLLAAAEDPLVEEWVRQFAAGYIVSTVRGDAPPEPDMQALNGMLDGAVDRLARQYGLSELTAGLDAVKAGAENSAASLAAAVRQLGALTDSLLPAGVTAGMARILMRPAFLAGLTAALCALGAALCALAPAGTRLIWCCVPPLLCGGICFLLGRSGETAENAGGLAASWAARLQDIYTIAGGSCFILCAVLTGLYAALNLRRAHRRAPAGSRPAAPQL